MADEIEKNEKAEYEAKKEYLMSYRIACRRIDNLKEQLESLREVEQSAKSQQVSDMPRGGTGQQDLSALMARLEELRTKINDEIIESQKIRIDIEETISGIEDSMEQKVLRLKYIAGLKWKEISKRIDYSYRQTLNIHEKALKKLQW